MQTTYREDPGFPIVYATRVGSDHNVKPENDKYLQHSDNKRRLAALTHFIKRSCRAPNPEGKSVGDYGLHIGTPKTLEQCASLCQTNAGCNSFVVGSGGKCHLKDACHVQVPSDWNHRDNPDSCQEGTICNYTTYFKKACPGSPESDTCFSVTGSTVCTNPSSGSSAVQGFFRLLLFMPLLQAPTMLPNFMKIF